MRLAAIVAMSENRVIGKDNKLPWHLPADLKYFKKITLNKTILMGRRTYESIGRPLPQRKNIIVTRDKNFAAAGCLVFHSIDAALASAAAEEEVIVIGGAVLFQQLLPRFDRLYLTLIHAAVEGDAFFPEVDMNEWAETSRAEQRADEQNAFDLSFLVLDKPASKNKLSKYAGAD